MARGADESILGREIAGKYRVDSFIGGGAMGAVYRARQRDIDKAVAIKVLHRELADPQFAARFKREAKAASRMDHPNSMRVLDFGEEPDGLCYIVMELVDGRTLFHVLREESPLARDRIVDFLRQTLAALAVAHDMGVVHRDLKPENIMILRAVDDEGEVVETVKVCDFGMAKISASRQDAEELASEKLTSHGVVVGTPEYMSPEQGKGEALDGRSDLYAVGVILYQMITGRLPFTAETPVGVLLKQLVEEPVAPSQVNPAVDPALEAVALRAMRKRPEERFGTAREMRGALGAASSGTLPHVASSGSMPHAGGPPPRGEHPPARGRLGDTQRPAAAAGPRHPPDAGSAARLQLEQAPTTEVAIMRPARPALRLARDILSDPPPPPQRSMVPAVVGVVLLLGLAAAAVVGRERWQGLVSFGGGEVAPATSVAAPGTAPAPPVHAAPDAASTLAAASEPSGDTPKPAVAGAPAARPSGAAVGPDPSTRAPSRPVGSVAPPPPNTEWLPPAPVVPTVPGVPGSPGAATPSPAGVPTVADLPGVPMPAGTAAEPGPTATPGAPGAAGSFDSAHVVLGSITADKARPADVLEALPVDRFERCYRSALRAGASRVGGSGVLHLDVDPDGEIAKASFAGTEPFREAGHCIVNATLGRKVKNLTAGAADADVPLSFKAE